MWDDTITGEQISILLISSLTHAILATHINDA